MRKNIITAACLAIASLCFHDTLTAQIKVVGNDYGQSLTSKDFYDQDVNFETYFPAIDPKLQLGRLELNPPFSVNLIGDTVWLGISASISKDNFAVLNGKLIDTIPAGYYVISGYIFGEENVKEVCNRYRGENPKFSTYGIKGLENEIIRKPSPNEKDRCETIKGYLGYMKLTALDTSEGVTEVYFHRSNNYYPDADLSPDPINNLVSMRFYNEIVHEYQNKKVYLLQDDKLEMEGNAAHKQKKYQFHPAFTDMYGIREGFLIRDVMANKQIRLQDSIFTVKDIVMKVETVRNQYGKPQPRVMMYFILHGENTGSFAMRVHSALYQYSYGMHIRNFGQAYMGDASKHFYGEGKYFDMPLAISDYRTSGNPKISIFPTEYLQKLNDRFNDSVAVKVRIEETNRAVLERENRERELRMQEEKAQWKAERKRQMISKYGEKYGELVANDRVAIGMTKSMCRDAWGRPSNTYRTTTKFGQSEVWCYNYKTRIYFYDGKVVQIDN